MTIEKEYEQFKKDLGKDLAKKVCKNFKEFVAKRKSWKKESGVTTIKLPAESNVAVDVAKKNLAYALGWGNSGYDDKELIKFAKSGAESFASNVYYNVPYDSEIDLTVELRAWLKPSYFPEIKLPLPELKLYVMQTWDDLYVLFEKYKLW